ncbi:Electron transport complex subunit RsxA [Collinsella sp. AK_207A]|uniref:Rnf-Nqr domain containing protein n=1 Tax=Collinsella sp. AK_207A TaxID=2650472 RepID=UPI0012606F3D|nr:Rnf-Nqr domain containing protein [Collinsella sp. AK_207A]VWL99113.1 Electron transport complex subunit RsxA [Collinsella sp. AK_207A]
MAFINALFTSMLDNNLVFCQLIAMVTVILAAKRSQDGVCFGTMLGCATAAAGAFGALVYAGFLAPWGVGYLAPVVYAILGAAVAFVGGAVAASRKGAADRGLALRLVALLAANAALMGAALANGVAFDSATATADVLFGNALGSGLGVFLAVVLFTSIRARIDDRLVPHAMRGLPIALVTASLMAMAFTCVAGIAGGLFV